MKLSSRARLTLAVSALLIASGCTRIREARFPEGAGDNLFEVSLFADSLVSVETAAAPRKDQQYKHRFKSVQQLDLLAVERVEGPKALRSMFKGLELPARAEARYSVRFALDRQFLTAFRVVDASEELSVEDRQLALSVPKALGAPELWVPIFQYRVREYGKVVRSRNELGEETSTLRLKATEWAQASHVRISNLPEDRIPVSAPSLEAADRIFVRERLEGAVLTRQELASELQVQVDRGSLFQLAVDGSELVLSELVALSDSSITESQRQLVLAQDRGAPRSHAISRCGEAIDSRLPGALPDCVRVIRYRVPVAHVEARRKAADLDGTLSAEIEYRSVSKTDSSRLLEITRNPLLSEVGAVSADPRRALKVSELKGTEFLFRRTLEDSPNSFEYTFAGSSGPLEIVRFIFEKGRVRIVRADALVPTSGGNRVDLADLMSMPARYVREVSTDANGNRLAHPRLLDADHTHPDAVAQVEWEGNSVPPVSSALNYYELGQCFVGPTDVAVAEVDHRLDRPEGVLNFSIELTYANHPSVDCAGVYEAGYFDQVQPSFTFRERISLKKYQKGDEQPLLALPYEAQKRLGFGIFTYKKNSPNRFGNVGTDGTETALPAIFDLRQGRSVRYVLAGLPSDGELRAALIEATREVIADWNTAFRKAFRGTTMERESDVIELAIDGEGAPAGSKPGALGDLDVNHIYFIPKRTRSGVIGLGGAHSNPRSGKVEAASVFIYGGNILSFVESIRRMDSARTEHLKQVASPSIRVSEPASPGTPPASTPAGHEAGRASGQVTGRIAMGRGRSNDEKLSALSALAGQSPQLAFYEAMQQAARDGRLGDERHVSKVFSKALLKSMQGRLGRTGLARLRAELKRNESVSDLFDRLERAGVCAHPAPQPGAARFRSDLADVSDIDLVVSVYKPTLAHELGHNLGLRHNFVASFDKENWKFDGFDPSERDYSSVMDYLSNDHETYDGPGPQDIAAIRAAYAGKLEAADGSLLGLEEARQKLGLESWNRLSREQVSRLKLRPYLFCSDEEAGELPICNRFDRGTTPSEIVEAIVDDYRSLYGMTNFAGDRLRFSQLESGGYLGRLFSKFVPIRQFLEETIYQAINWADGEVVNAYASAAMAGMQFFHSVIRTPDAPVVADESDRVIEIALEGGKTARIERRWLKDIGFEAGEDRLRVRGVEFDKVVALMMLTDRQLGFSRYEASDLRYSYPEFEKMLMQGEGSPDQHPTHALLGEILMNRIEPQGLVLDAKGQVAGALRLDSRFKAETTEMIRFYAVLGAIVSQDVDGLAAGDNGSRLFRVMSGFSAPAQAATVVQPGASRDDADQLKYWTPSDARVARALLDRLMVLESVSSQSKALAGAFAGAASDPKPLEDLLLTLPESAGSRSREEFAAVLAQVRAIAKALEQSKSRLGARDYALILDLRTTQISNLLRENPALAAALQSAASEEGASPELVQLLESASLSSERGVVFSNLELLARMLQMLHPELRR
jgi:hypothetical protein